MTFSDDELVALGDCADKATWRTPRYQTYGRGFSSERVAEYRRKDGIAVGRNLLLLLDEAGYTLKKKKAKKGAKGEWQE